MRFDHFPGDSQMRYMLKQKFWSWDDDIVPNEDDVAILSTVVIIDLVCHGEKQGGAD